MEIPSSQHPGLISKSQTEEKARFTTAISKIMPVVGLVKKMYGTSRLTKLIRTDYSTYKLTQTPSVILDNIRVSHPLVKLLMDYVKKLESLGDSSKFFLVLVGNLVEESVKVLERGVKATVLSEILREIEIEVENYEDEDFIPWVKYPKVGELLKELKDHTEVRVCKIPSGSLEDSYVVNGLVFEREPEGKVKGKAGASTAIYNSSLDIPRGELKSTIQMATGDQLTNFSREEVERIRETVGAIPSDVVVFSGRLNDVFLDFLDKANKLVFKVMSKHDLRRLRDLVGGSISSELHDGCICGHVDEVSVFSAGGRKYTRFVSRDSKVSTIVLRHPLEYKLDELERCINKALKKGDGRLCENFVKKLQGAFEAKRKEEESLEKSLVYECLANALEGLDSYGGPELYTPKLKAVSYALEFLGTMYEIEDYLVGIPPKLNIKPQTNQHWDEDH